MVLHFRDQRKHIERGRVQSLCRRHLPGYEKVVPCEKLLPHYEDAVRRAMELAAWQQAQGRPRGNPSTDVHLLTERIRAYGQPR